MFKNKLKELREKEGLSQQELADKLFVSRSAIAKWENGKGIPSDVNLDAICKFFDVKKDWLLDRIELKKIIRLNNTKSVEILVIIFLLVIIFIFNTNKYNHISSGHYFATITSIVTLLYLIYNLFNKKDKVFKIINILFMSLCYVLNIINWLITSYKYDVHFLRIIQSLYANIDIGLARAQFSSIINIAILSIVLILNMILNIKQNN